MQDCQGVYMRSSDIVIRILAEQAINKNLSKYLINFNSHVGKKAHQPGPHFTKLVISDK